MIKNIVFDIGNVLLRWQPITVVRKIFPDRDAAILTQLLFKSTLWCDLNLGKMTEAEAISHYHRALGISIDTLNTLMQEVKASLLPVDEEFTLLSELSQYHLYALTDNVREIVAYLKEKYHFWDKFKGVVVSAEVGYLKPAPEIYYKLFNTYNIDPAESVFIDDHSPNVEGARAVGMQSIQFIDPQQCRDELSKILK